MKDVGPLMKAITEQVNDPNAPDPFEPIPLPFVHDKSTPEYREQQQLEAEKAHVGEKIASFGMVLNNIRALGETPAFGAYTPGRNAVYTYVQNKKATAAPGHVIVDGYDYTLSLLPQKKQDWLVKYGPTMNALIARRGAIDRRLKAIQKAVKTAEVIASATAAGLSATPNATSATAGQIPVAQIPQKLGTSPGATNIDNPYFKGAGYAGPIAGYKFSTPMQRIYVSLEATLKRHGLTLGTLYVGRHGGPTGPINFVTEAGGSKLVWRKYDAGGASGQNWIYLNGHKMNTSSFIQMTEPQRDAALKVNKVI